MKYDIFEKFVNEYMGPKVAFIVTGGGSGIYEVPRIVGSSRVLHAIFTPYAYDASEKFISDAYNDDSMGKRYSQKAVCEDSAKLLCSAGMRHWPGCKVVACTAATTTSHFRHGLNEAYVAVGCSPEQMETHHLILSKLSETEYQKSGLGFIAWKRRAEDREITKFLLDATMR